MSDSIRLVFVDDLGLCRKTLSELVERRTGMTVLATVGKPREARLNDPYLAVIDLRKDKTDGLSLICQVRSEPAAAPVVFLTVGDGKGGRATTLKIDVQTYLRDDLNAGAVIGFDRRSAPDEWIVAPEIAGELAEDFDNPLQLLTERERQVLEHVVRGMSNKAIARALAISHDTVKLHVRHILAKFKVVSRVEAAVLAVGQQMNHSVGKAGPRKLRVTDRSIAQAA